MQKGIVCLEEHVHDLHQLNGIKIKANTTHEEKKNLEIKTETVQQHDHKGKSMVLHAKMDREKEISRKLINVFKDN